MRKRDRLVHVNSNNETLDLFALGVSVESNNLRDFEWSYENENEIIRNFNKKVSKKSITLVFHCRESKANEIKNKVYEHFEVDVLNGKHGYFLLNGYKYYCYLTKSVKDKYNYTKRYLELKADIVTDRNYWLKETMKEINFSIQEDSNALKYAFTYPFIYSGLNGCLLENENFVESDLLIRVFGQCENPLLTINDNIYQVNTALDAGEYLEIDTENRTIFKYSNYGEKTNLFNYRNKKYDAFRKAPSGTLNISANGQFKADIVLFEKRGEPKWI